MFSVQNFGQIHLQVGDLSGEENSHAGKPGDDGKGGNGTELVVAFVEILQAVLNTGPDSEVIDNDVFKVVIELERFRDKTNSRVTFSAVCLCCCRRSETELWSVLTSR